jgi:hypothetical protein
MRVVSMETCAHYFLKGCCREPSSSLSGTHYFLKGYYRVPGTETLLEPRVNEVVVLEDFFTEGLRMAPHLVLVEILQKF